MIQKYYNYSNIENVLKKKIPCRNVNYIFEGGTDRLILFDIKSKKIDLDEPYYNRCAF